MTTPDDWLEQCTTDEREAVLAAAWCVAMADGRLWRERTLLDKIARKLQTPKKTAARLADAARDGTLELTVPEAEPAGRLAYHYAVQVAVCGARIDPGEREVVERLGQGLGLSAADVAAELDSTVDKTKRRNADRLRRARRKRDRSSAKSAPGLLATLVGGSWKTPDGADRPRRGLVWAILLGNLVPVVGVLLLGWDEFAVVLVYWLENGVIGLFNVLKMSTAGRGGAAPKETGLLIPFFMFHYGGFMFGHGLFIICMLGDGAGLPRGATFALGWLFLEHAYAFYTGYWKSGKYKKADAFLLMMAPYPRIIVMHVVIIFGAMLIQTLGLPAMVAVLLIVVKTFLELVYLAITPAK